MLRKKALHHGVLLVFNEPLQHYRPICYNKQKAVGL